MLTFGHKMGEIEPILGYVSAVSRQRSSSGGNSDGSLTRLPASMLQRLLVEPWHCQRRGGDRKAQ